MKKTLLSAVMALGALWSYGQIATAVLQPASLVGSLAFEWNDPLATQNLWAAAPDLRDPANLVVAYTIFVDDGTAGDSLACNALVNGADIAGKIAVLYRGTCEFGLKALNAQNAGAVAVVIINNQGAPVGMAAGASGGTVSIPVVMISTDAGAALRNEIIAGNVEMLIGNVQGYFPNNISVSKDLALMPAQSALPKWLATDNTEFSADLGTWLKNFGSSTQTDVSVTGVVTQNGMEIYNNTSASMDLNPGDSAFFALPLFSQATYSGFYDFTYTVNSSNTDDFPDDNVFAFNMSIDSIFAYARLDSDTKLTIPTEQFKVSGSAGNFSNCVHFRNANASRVKAEGIYGSASKLGNVSMDGAAIEGRIYEWNDAFTDLSIDPTYNDIIQIDAADYFYSSDLSGENVYIPFNEPVVLEDNRRYLFCTFAASDSIFLGYNTTTDYTKTQDNLLQPISVLNDNGDWNAVGFGADVVSAVAVRMSPTDVGINEQNRVDVTPYPNPTNDFITIPLPGQNGAATLQMFDLAGKKVAEQKVSVANNGKLTVDVSGISTGTYLFNMNFENGQYASFRVVVTK